MSIVSPPLVLVEGAHSYDTYSSLLHDFTRSPHCSCGVIQSSNPNPNPTLTLTLTLILTLTLTLTLTYARWQLPPALQRVQGGLRPGALR